jgi:tetratricopeptide (TPR) repeat protein
MDSDGARASDILVGPLVPPEQAQAAASVWYKAAHEGDQLWMEGIEKRFGGFLVHIALSIALKESRIHTLDWSPEDEALLVERTGLAMDPAERAGINGWLEAYTADNFEQAAAEAKEWPAATDAGTWLKTQALGVALYQAGRYLEAINLLNSLGKGNPVLRRRSHYVKIECLRRAGRLAEAGAEWIKLADQVINNNDTRLSSPLLDSAIAIRNLSETPLDRGRMVSLGELAESWGDIASAWRAYQDIWSDPLLPETPEVVATKNEAVRRAGLGILRIISGGGGQGDHASMLDRWMERIMEQPPTRGRAACACELARFEGAVALRQARLALALKSLDEAVEWAEKSNDTALIARARGDLAVAQANCGEIEKALQNSDLACRVAEAAGDLELLYQANRNRLILLTGTTGETPEAFQNLVKEQGKRLGHLAPGEFDKNLF